MNSVAQDSMLDDQLESALAAAERRATAVLFQERAAFFDRFDVVLREDFDVQRKLLERAQAKLAALEARVAELEARRAD